MDLALSTRVEGDCTLITIEGELDVYSAPALRQQLIDLLAAGNRRLIVDLDKVEFIDSTGLGVLVGGLKRARALDGTLDLVCTQPSVLKILRVTGLTNVFRIDLSVDDAVRKAQP